MGPYTRTYLRIILEKTFDFLIQKHAKVIRENVTNAYN